MCVSISHLPENEKFEEKRAGNTRYYCIPNRRKREVAFPSRGGGEAGTAQVAEDGRDPRSTAVSRRGNLSGPAVPRRTAAAGPRGPAPGSATRPVARSSSISRRAEVSRAGRRARRPRRLLVRPGELRRPASHRRAKTQGSGRGRIASEGALSREACTSACATTCPRPSGVERDHQLLGLQRGEQGPQAG